MSRYTVAFMACCIMILFTAWFGGNWEPYHAAMILIVLLECNDG